MKVVSKINFYIFESIGYENSHKNILGYIRNKSVKAYFLKFVIVKSKIC